jgi:hypothetical protein
MDACAKHKRQTAQQPGQIELFITVSAVARAVAIRFLNWSGSERILRSRRSA